jgi:glucosamine-6-phosphate deaminase
MDVCTSNTTEKMGQKAALDAAARIRNAIDDNGQANIILATGASQLHVLGNLVRQPDIDWSRVVMFHLDEYIGLPQTHPASFRRYLQERFVDQVPELQAVHFVETDKRDPAEECSRLNDLANRHPIDVVLIGIGENGHIAFNDPPADFDTEKPYIIVDLDAACRQQQVGEGWYASLDEVPAQAISMSVRQILKSMRLIVSVPDERKAEAVRGAVEGPVTNTCPASILQQHSNCTLYLDAAAASLLTST